MFPVFGTEISNLLSFPHQYPLLSWKGERQRCECLLPCWLSLLSSWQKSWCWLFHTIPWTKLQWATPVTSRLPRYQTSSALVFLSSPVHPSFSPLCLPGSSHSCLLLDLWTSLALFLLRAYALLPSWQERASLHSLHDNFSLLGLSFNVIFSELPPLIILFKLIPSVLLSLSYLFLVCIYDILYIFVYLWSGASHFLHLPH